jgi:hypothetical protein
MNLTDPNLKLTAGGHDTPDQDCRTVPSERSEQPFFHRQPEKGSCKCMPENGTQTNVATYTF